MGGCDGDEVSEGLWGYNSALTALGLSRAYWASILCAGGWCLCCCCGCNHRHENWNRYSTRITVLDVTFLRRDRCLSVIGWSCAWHYPSSCTSLTRSKQSSLHVDALMRHMRGTL